MSISRTLTLDESMLLNLSPSGRLIIGVEVDGGWKYLTLTRVDGDLAMLTPSTESLYNDIVGGTIVLRCVMDEFITASCDAGEHVNLGRLRPWWRELRIMETTIPTLLFLLTALIVLSIRLGTPDSEQLVITLGGAMVWVCALQCFLVNAIGAEYPRAKLRAGV